MADGSSRSRVAILAVLAVLATASVVLAGQAVIGDLERSRDESQSPVLYAEVEDAVVRDTISGPAEVQAGFERDLRVPKGGIFTREGVAAGAEVALGTAVATFGERPYFVLQGAVPAYRGLAVGSTGSDVAQLQASLAALGYAVGDQSGTYGSSTARAVFALYTDRGYAAVDAGGVATTRARTAAFPAGEFEFLPSLPVVALTACGHVGEQVPDTACTVAGGSALLTVTIARVDASRAVEGLSVTVELEGSGPVDGLLGPSLAGPEPEAEDESVEPPDVVKFAIVVDPETMLALGARGRGTVLIEESAPGALSISAVAIRTDSAGSAWLVDPEGDRADVRLGLCAEGRCVVEGEVLARGDRFVIPSTR